MAKIIQSCAECGKKFVTYHAELKMFCSVGCQYADPNPCKEIATGRECDYCDYRTDEMSNMEHHLKTEHFDNKRISSGLYKIHWASGGYSWASIGICTEGRNWIAPTNWVFPAEIENHPNADGRGICWADIKSVEKIECPEEE
jgi:hypothetical protein